MTNEAYDPKCGELAEYFLSDEEHTPQDVAALAQEIQSRALDRESQMTNEAPRSRFTTPISEQTEQELINTILLIYSGDEKTCRAIALHIATKLTQRRTIIRGRRVSKERPPHD